MSNISLSNSVYSCLVCANCGDSLSVADKSENIKCSRCKAQYPIIDGIPVLINDENHYSIFRGDDFTERKSLFFNLSDKGKLKSKIAGLIPTMGGNNLGKKNFRYIADSLKKDSTGKPRVLMLGASIEGTGTSEFLADDGLEILESDVSFGPRTEIILDAHNIPFADCTFDAVIAQAVLEHVVAPQQCVDEIHRVLKPDGLVYTEIPFMQQVHGAEYDFTRFTHSGHRYLMRAFTEIKSGATAGAGTVMAWSYEYLLLSIFGISKLREPIKFFARITGSWLRLLDYLSTQQRTQLNGCSGSFFIGKKNNDVFPVKELRPYYYQQEKKS